VQLASNTREHEYKFANSISSSIKERNGSPKIVMIESLHRISGSGIADRRFGSSPVGRYSITKNVCP
jgi:hypothetical protein